MENNEILHIATIFRPVYSPIIPPPTPPTQQPSVIQALPRPVCIPCNKRKWYTFATKQKVFNAVKVDELKHADAGVKFGIAGGKSTVQKS